MNFGIENEMIEFKSSLSQLSRALESLAAMLNKRGKGKIYFGVDDKGDLLGVQIGNKTLKDLSHAITSRIKPQVIPNIGVETYDGKSIIVCYAEGRNKPYSADGDYLIRSGSENKKIDPDLLRTLMFSNSVEYISTLESFNQQLTFNEIRQLYISKRLKINEDQFLYNLGFILSNNKFNELANLLSDNNDYSIKVVRFSGTDKTNMVFRNEYGYRCLLMAMTDAFNYVKSLNETRVQLSGNLSREEIHLFDEDSLKEAWVNACLHTNWAKRVPPAIYIFDDRIEIVSTGGIPYDLPLESFYKGVSYPINLQLQRIMGQLGYVEQTGHGVLTILKTYGKEAFTITENNVVVTLRFPFPISSKEAVKDSLTPSQKKVYETIKNNPLIKTNEVSKVTNLSIASINKIIATLKQFNKIKRIGSNKSGYWLVL